MYLKEEFYKLIIRGLLRVIHDLHRFGMAGISVAYLPVRRILYMTPCIPGDDCHHPRLLLQEILDSPEASAGKEGSAVSTCRQYLRYEVERYRIDAVTCILRGEPFSGEDMTEVSAA